MEKIQLAQAEEATSLNMNKEKYSAPQLQKSVWILVSLTSGTTFP